MHRTSIKKVNIKKEVISALLESKIDLQKKRQMNRKRPQDQGGQLHPYTNVCHAVLQHLKHRTNLFYPHSGSIDDDGTMF